MPSEAGVRLFGSARLNEADTRSNLIDPAIDERGWKVPDLISSPGTLANYMPTQGWSNGEGLSFLHGSCEGVDPDNPHRSTLRTAMSTASSKMPTPPEMPDDAHRHVVRGELMLKDGHFDRALVEFNEALRMAPYMPKLYYNTALIYGELKQYD